IWPLLLRPELRFLLSMSFSKGRPLCRSWLTTFTSPRRPGEVGLTLMSGMALCLLREVDFLAWLQADVRFLPVATSAGKGAEALFLAVNVHDLDARDLDLLLLPQQLDRPLHVFLGRIGPDAKDDLIMAIGDLRRLLGDDGREENRHEALFVGLERRDLRYRFGRAHPSSSSNCVTAALVSSTFSKRTKLTGSTSCVSRTSTCGR